ncbi:MAG: hypothetical protein MUC28_00925 [Planctomycetes bacterium]|nr:hypothetical protein [Planctomycetota bacterium]
MKLTWVNFLHFYQPATVDNETVVEATEKSYRRIIGALKRHPRIRFTANIAGCLLDKWHKLGYDNLIKDIHHLARRGQIELTGSAANHSLLPFLPADEIKRQVVTQNGILKKYFGRALKLSGFFMPEAAYDRRVARLIKSLGFAWTILDEISAFGRIDGLDQHIKYKDRYSGLTLVFRSRAISHLYVPQEIRRLLSEGRKDIAITASDAELYGLRHNDVSANFEKMLKQKNLATKTFSQYIAQTGKTVIIRPIASSWESTAAELKRGVPYHLWRDPKNKIHARLWELADLALRTVNRYPQDKNFPWARVHLDKGLSSCTFWWASGQDLCQIFGPVCWNPDEIERGLNELIRSVRALDDATTRETKMKAEKLYISVKRMIWQKHWRYYWKK